MTSFGHLPRTRVLDGAPGAWSGDNDVFTGIRVYRVPNMAGIWAQEYWEWRLHALWTALSALAAIAGAVAAYVFQSWLPLVAGSAVYGIAMAIGLDHRAAREIYSHAITYQAGRMLGLPVTEEEMVGSLATYSYCKGIGREAMLERMRAGYPKARAWCERHRGKIARLTRL